ncbi:acyl-CoA dehydrogenase family protein, partial [Acinetobacter baumannii]
LTPVVKSWSSEWGLVANDLAIQVHGGYGYTREYNVEQFYRDNRLNPIHEGTFGIQAMDLLGRKTRINDGLAMHILNEKITGTIAQAQSIA